jgi:hypothetical protein
MPEIPRDEILESAARASTLAWVRINRIVNEKGERIKVGPNSPHFFLEALYEDEADDIVTQKPSQAGVSTYAILTEIHDARYWGINQIHTLPTVADVGKFVPSKTNEIIKRNPVIKRGMGKKDVESVGTKQFGKGFVYYKGTHSERESLMLTSDRNWYDELDKSDMGQIGNYESRMEGATSLKQRRSISTPTLPGYGINKAFIESDQKEWRFTCGKCHLRQHMEWPANVDMKKRIYVCRECGAPITNEIIRAGRWEARYPGRKISGYHITQMIVPWISAGNLIDYWNDAVAGKNEATMEYFYNHKLGLPYVSAESAIPASTILRNLTTSEHLEINSVMGVDVQERELYLMIGNEQGIYVIARVPDIYEGEELVKSKWDRWAEMMEVYDVRYCVIDGGYKPNDSIAAARRFPGRVWVNWYKESSAKAKIIRFQDEDFQGKQEEDPEDEYKVLTDRDRIIDYTLAQLRNGFPRFFYGPHDEAVKMLIAHVSTTYARTVTDRLGQIRREWVSTGKDDLLHALIYYMIGMEKKRKNES